MIVVMHNDGYAYIVGSLSVCLSMCAHIPMLFQSWYNYTSAFHVQYKIRMNKTYDHVSVGVITTS